MLTLPHVRKRKKNTLEDTALVDFWGGVTFFLRGSNTEDSNMERRKCFCVILVIHKMMTLGQ